MADYSQRCSEFLVATAFVNDWAIDAVLREALDVGASVRFLTGTFGNATRKRTFKRLLRLAGDGKLAVRVWNGDVKRAFHAKMYLWRFKRGSSIAWIGSANFTRGGLQNRGELVAEVRDAWHRGPIARMRAAFEDEWARGFELNGAFLKSYREARATPPDGAPIWRRAATRAGGDVLITSSVRDFDHDSPIVRRVDGMLSSDCDWWLRTSIKPARRAREGSVCVIADRPSRTVTLGRALEVARDGKYVILALDMIRETAWNRDTSRILEPLGISLPRWPRAPRSRWIPGSVQQLSHALRSTRT